MGFNPLALRSLLEEQNPWAYDIAQQPDIPAPEGPTEGYNPFTGPRLEASLPQQQEPVEPSPTKKPTRLMLRDILSNALYSFGQGMLAASKAPSGSQAMAAMGGALVAPYEREQIERRMSLEEARQRLYDAQVAQAMANAAAIPEREETRREQIENALRMFTERLQAGAPLREAQTKRQRYLSTPAGLIDLGGEGEEPRLIEGTASKAQIELTPEIAKALGLPEKVIGMRMPVADLNQLAAAAQRPLRVVPTAEGVMAYNLVTGEKQKIGEIPPPRQVGMFVPQLNENGEITGYFNPTTGRAVGQPEEFAGARRAGLPIGEIEKRVTLENLLEDADFIEAAAKENPQAIGPAAGRFATALHQYAPSVLQQMFPSYSKPEVMEMFRVALNIRNQLLYALSGKQINEREYERLQQLVPLVNVSPETFQARLNEYRYELQRALARRKGQEPPAPPPAARKGAGKSELSGLSDEELFKRLAKKE